MEDPIKLAEHGFRMSQQYNVYCKEYAEIKKTETEEKLELRKETKTVTEANWKYYATAKGKRGTELKFLLEGLSKEMNGSKALVYAYQSHNF